MSHTALLPLLYSTVLSVRVWNYAGKTVSKFTTEPTFTSAWICSDLARSCCITIRLNPESPGSCCISESQSLSKQCIYLIEPPALFSTCTSIKMHDTPMPPPAQCLGPPRLRKQKCHRCTKSSLRGPLQLQKVRNNPTKGAPSKSGRALFHFFHCWHNGHTSWILLTAVQEWTPAGVAVHQRGACSQA